MRSPYVLIAAVLTACGPTGPDITITTQFEVTTVTGGVSSPLDPLLGTVIDVELVLDPVRSSRGGDGATCTVLELADIDATRTARGATAALVQSEILDRLVEWDVRFELCEAPSQSVVIVDAVIDPLNLLFACTGIPTSALRRSGGYPQLSSFTATACHAVILDVVNARTFSSPDFTLEIATGPDHLP